MKNKWDMYTKKELWDKYMRTGNSMAAVLLLVFVLFLVGFFLTVEEAADQKDAYVNVVKDYGNYICKASGHQGIAYKPINDFGKERHVVECEDGKLIFIKWVYYDTN